MIENFLPEDLQCGSIVSHALQMPAVELLLDQPFFVAGAFTGTAGKDVKLEDTVKGFKMIVDGELDELPEQAFYMKGGIEDVIQHGEKLLAANAS